MEEEPQAAVIADVATNPAPPPTALEEAVGRVNPIYVVVPIAEADGTTYLQVAKGGVFSYYEFPWPIDDRLTDEKWRGMLDDGTRAGVAGLDLQLPGGRDRVRRPQPRRHAVPEVGDPGLLVPRRRVPLRRRPGGGAGVRRDQLVDGRAALHGPPAGRFRVPLLRPAIADAGGRDGARDLARTRSTSSASTRPRPTTRSSANAGRTTLDATYTLELKDVGQGPLWQVTNVVYAQEPPGF